MYVVEIVGESVVVVVDIVSESGIVFEIVDDSEVL